ncbi:MAG TPA: PCP reductase family protein, partial [Candidatus Eisenbacteria bacterium]|nr:PCP reductase family protein [Candidatus Eisenbacteria bacterium]
MRSTRAVSREIQAAGPTMPWDDAASRRLERVPEFVRGQVIQAVEGYDRVSPWAGLDISALISVI